MICFCVNVCLRATENLVCECFSYAGVIMIAIKIAKDGVGHKMDRPDDPLTL